jgi:hypothetical protein
MRKKTALKRADRAADDHLRIILAQEAARLICDHGITDYLSAKHKAAEKLGLTRCRALPNNREIELAIAERSRIFHADSQSAVLTEMRLTAVAVMQELGAFQPLLVGSVLTGNITERSAIELQLFSEPAENVGAHLLTLHIRYRCLAQHLKLRRDKPEAFPAYRFEINTFEVLTTVLPERQQMHAPLSPIDGKPMRRARLQEVQQLAGMA